MRKTAFALLALSLISPACAQSLLDHAPIDAVAGTVVSVTRIGDAFAISGKAELALKQASRSFEALLPAASSQLPCRNGN